MSIVLNEIIVTRNSNLFLVYYPTKNLRTIWQESFINTTVI